VAFAYAASVMSVDIVLGLQRGDEGKGRFVDLLAARYDVVARFNGGPNAGHTIAREGAETLKLHQVPSGIAHPNVVSVVGNGALVDPLKLWAEIRDIERGGIEVSPASLKVSADAHMILPHHISQDEIREAGSGSQGTTKSGIPYVARDKYERCGLRLEQLLDDPAAVRGHVQTRLSDVNPARKAAGLPEHNAEAEARVWLEVAKKIIPFVTDTFTYIHEALAKDQRLLAEGAQATLLDIEHGMYPFVTSSHTTTGGALNGLGIGPQQFKRVIGVAKVLKSHVGGGPFVTKETDPIKAATIRGQKGSVDSEYGATTGRERQVGYLDLPELRRAILVNGITEIALTKMDLLPRAGKTIPVAVSYTHKGHKLPVAPSSAAKLAVCKPVYKKLPAWSEDISTIRDYKQLPKATRQFIEFLEDQLTVPVTMIGVGPYRDQVIVR